MKVSGLAAGHQDGATADGLWLLALSVLETTSTDASDVVEILPDMGEHYYRYTGCPSPGYYYYSFALHPERYQPSGTFNFSRVTNKFIDITNDPYSSSIHVLSNRYNVADRNIPIFLD